MNTNTVNVSSADFIITHFNRRAAAWNKFYTPPPSDFSRLKFKRKAILKISLTTSLKYVLLKKKPKVNHNRLSDLKLQRICSCNIEYDSVEYASFVFRDSEVIIIRDARTSFCSCEIKIKLPWTTQFCDGRMMVIKLCWIPTTQTNFFGLRTFFVLRISLYPSEIPWY